MRVLNLSHLGDLPPIDPQSKKEDNDRFQILVVFVGHTECRWLRWLKQGFKHCFVALHKGDRWIICDSLKNYLELTVLILPQNFCLSQFYRHRGYAVLGGRGPCLKAEEDFKLEILTCVSVVKRIIGLRSFWTLTPWQLFCHLKAMDGDWRLID